MKKNDDLNTKQAVIKEEIYNKCAMQISDLVYDKECKEYNGCQYKLNDLNIVSRSAKITPKKAGQFVTFWKRNLNGYTEPFNQIDNIDFYVVNVNKENRTGQFVFPKIILIEKGIMSTHKIEGKRGFRVYPSWDTVNNRQAEKTQKWQLAYFMEIDDFSDMEVLKNLYNI